MLYSEFQVALEGFCSFFAIQSELGKHLIFELKSDIVQILNNFLIKSKETINNQSQYGKDSEKKIKILIDNYEKVLKK